MGKRDLQKRYDGAALVTGASSGLGETFARRLAEEGLDLVLVARSKDKLENFAKELSEKYGVRAHAVAADLSETDAPERVKNAVDALGVEVGVLVNNAGYGSHGLFDTLDLENETRMVDLNCRAPVALTGKFLPGMLQRGRGALIFLSSIASYQPTPWFATYGASKAFNLLFGEALWAELKPRGVDVIALSPGYTRSEFQKKAEVKNKAVGGWSTPEAVVDRCLNKLGKKPSTIPGFRNWLLAWSIRFTPRRMAATVAYEIGKPG